MLLNCGVGEDSWESLGLQGDRTSPSSRKSVLNIIGRTDRLSGNSNTLATWCEELSRWKRLWCWERLKVGRQGDKKGWDCWMVSLAQWIWVWVNSGSCWWTGRPGVLQSMGLQRVRHDWATELHRTEPPGTLNFKYLKLNLKVSSWVTLATSQALNSHMRVINIVLESTFPSSWRFPLDDILQEGLTWALIWAWCRHFYSQIIGQD